MKNSGKLLKLERIKKGMKQVSLARGICSTSYLSKIENGHTYPSGEVINLLYERLGLDLSNYKTQNDEESYILHLDSFLKEMTLQKDPHAIKHKLEAVERDSYLFESENLYYDYILTVLRFYLANSDLQYAQYYLIYLDEEKDSLNDRQQYYLYKNNGVYHYLKKDYKSSFQYLMNALKKTEETVIADWEIADLYYMLGVASVADSQIPNAIEYSSLALTYFRDHFHFNRAIDCYITLGIAYKRGLNVVKALEMFEYAETISEKFNLVEYKGVIYQNVGSLYSSMGHFEQAIENYVYSLKSKQNEEKQLISILSIVKEYSKQNNREKVIHWINKGFTLLENHQKHQSYKAYYYHFTLYKQLYQNQYIQEKFAKEAIDYFESINDYRHCYKYSIKMASTLLETRKYKLSAQYYQKSLEYIKRKFEIHYWEDL
ncbi:helix-turn-helix domain-containing protein [Rossellomorea sp. DA94]|uniref:helix-turn-helix domain-containing protein n=1 Tax=Rossellomorea sp. DA94 TaxID=3038653 RepID=UPI0024499FBA|nr:helix-turn-helix domain-containing protein [Rossellomorea sp. DA94]WGG45356.1 helix-turn-helix domain-containing protein [Rossellomorea sp. DA94]